MAKVYRIILGEMDGDKEPGTVIAKYLNEDQVRGSVLLNDLRLALEAAAAKIAKEATNG